ncbi:MAG: hypothetical protein ABSA17_04210 [Rhabdochlamydiaceae bacterium]
MLRDFPTKKIKSKFILRKIFFLVGLILLGLFALGCINTRYEVGMLLFTYAFLGLLFGIIDIVILYYFAFRKRGTAWLTFSIWSYILGMVAGGIFILYILIYNDDPIFRAAYLQELRNKYPGQIINDPSPHFYALIVLNLFNAWVAVVMLEYYFALRARNFVYKYRDSFKSSEYLKAYRALDESKTIAELDSHYGLTMQKSPQMIKFIRPRYKKLKALLKKQALRLEIATKS